ncbi:Activator of SKN7 protein 10 [Frankliniella fusca]|uniref:Activator of SKN7 protein 10 n=1 Tax=Frankliniella fusca TaxID=407009 RepID=A0AAE1LLM2_9NEOP|nr:Activator of SKN7 protein 10 [Frankliniella fusca]
MSTGLVHDDDAQSSDPSELSRTDQSNVCEYQEDCHQSDDEPSQNSVPGHSTSCSTQGEINEEESAHESFTPSSHYNSSDVEQICEGVSVDNLPSDSDSENGGSDASNASQDNDDGEPLVPGTQHSVDKILFNEEAAGIKKHHFCYNCGKDFGQLQNATEILCKNKDCKQINQANDPRRWRYFVSFDILPQLQGLFNKTDVFEKLINPRDRINQYDDNSIRDVYDGEMYRKFVTNFCVSNEIRYISFTFNTDGVALYSSSNGSIWPIFLMVNELPPVLRMQNLIIAGLWFGKDHSIFDLFLRPTVDQLNKLSSAFVIAACVDSGAGGSVQGISSHSGFFSCNWCLIPGLYFDDKVIFPIIHPTPPLRSHEELELNSMKALTTKIPTSLSSMEKAEITKGAKSWCVFFGLESKSFNCVDGFVVDALHALDHGLARQCMKIWSDTDSDHNYITPAKELILDSYVDMLKPPVEIRKFPRKVSDRMTILSLACHLMHAHIVMHVCQTVRNWGPLWAISSAYAFEAGNGDVKKLLHSSNGVPNQVCRNLSHVICRNLLEQHFSSNQTKSYNISIMPKKPMKKCMSVGPTHFLKTPLPFSPIPEETYLCEQFNVVASDCMIYSKVIKDKMLIRSSCSRRSNNCIFVTVDHKIIRFSKLIFDSRQRLGFGFCHELHCSSILKPPPSVPTLAPKDECVRKVSRIGDELMLVPLTDVKMMDNINDKELLCQCGLSYYGFNVKCMSKPSGKGL